MADRPSDPAADPSRPSALGETTGRAKARKNKKQTNPHPSGVEIQTI